MGKNSQKLGKMYKRAANTIMGTVNPKLTSKQRTENVKKMMGVAAMMAPKAVPTGEGWQAFDHIYNRANAGDKKIIRQFIQTSFKRNIPPEEAIAKFLNASGKMFKQ